MVLGRRFLERRTVSDVVNAYIATDAQKHCVQFKGVSISTAPAHLRAPVVATETYLFPTKTLIPSPVTGRIELPSPELRDSEDGSPSFMGYFASDICYSVWQAVEKVLGYSAILSVPEMDSLPVTRKADMVSMALKGRIRSDPPTKSSINHSNSFANSPHDNASRETSAICGDNPAHASSDCFRSLRSRGKSVPRTARSALSVLKDTLGLNWPIDRPLVTSAITADGPILPKQSPSCPSELLKKFDDVARDPLVKG